jgi:hypothetical protein
MIKKNVVEDLGVGGKFQAFLFWHYLHIGGKHHVLATLNKNNLFP